MTKSILILGGTGLFGKPTPYPLKADGFQVRILARDVEKAQYIFTDGYEIMPGDVTDLARLEKAMTGCDGVHSSIGKNTPGETSQHRLFRRQVGLWYAEALTQVVHQAHHPGGGGRRLPQLGCNPRVGRSHSTPAR